MSTQTQDENQAQRMLSFLTSLKNKRIILLLVASAFALAIVVSLLLWAKRPNYEVLFSNVEAQDGGTIIQQLSQMNVPYQFADNGGTILVPQELVFETRMKLAQQGLPRAGSIGFELLDQDKFGISQFTEQVNYQRALEGELSRTIESLNPVVSARVHLAIPKPSLFVREQSTPSASISLKLYNGRTLDESQINAIVYLVSGSVAKLSADNVTIVDQNGRLLTSSNSSSSKTNTQNLKIVEELENRLQRNVENILAPVVGNGNVRAQVTVDMDFAVMEVTSELYGPNQPPDNTPAVRSRQISQSNQSEALDAGGVPGALSNQPTPLATAPINPANPATQANQQAVGTPPGAQTNTADQTQAPKSGASRRDELINFEVDRTIRHSQEQVGQIQRLSVAVVVNYITNPDGEKIPLTPEQRTEIESLVKQAVGFNDKRPQGSDSVTIVNTPFANLDPAEPVVPIWKQQRFIDLAISVLRYLLVLIVALVLWRKFIKPFVKKKSDEVNSNNTVTEGSTLSNDISGMSDGSEPIVLQQLSGGLTGTPLSSSDFSGLTSDDLVRHKRSQQRVTTEVKIQRIRDLADKDPRVVALVIRQWISNNE